MTEVINGLAATPTRRALLRAIANDRGRIYCEHGVVWDKIPYRRVTAQVKEMLAADWIAALAPGALRQPGESPLLGYYRLTDYGRAAMRGGT